MPGSILNADTGFPTFAEGEDSNAKIDKVMNYLHMLLEQLRYSLANLDADNFNDAGLKEIADGIARPLQTSFENEFGKTNALIEGWSNEYGSQIKLLTEWKGTASESISSLTQKADANAASIALLTQWKGTASSSIAAVQTLASQNGAKITSLTSWQSTVEDDLEGLASSVAYIEELADENGASISQIVQAVGKNGKVNAASIVAAVNDAGSSVMLNADRINLDGDIYISGKNNYGDEAMRMLGNSLQMLHFSGEDDSAASIVFWYDEFDGDLLGTISTTRNTDNERDARYAVTLQTFDRGSYPVALKLKSNGASSLDAETSVYMKAGTYFNIHAEYGTRIYAAIPFDAAIEDYPLEEESYIFCSEGIYFVDWRGDVHLVVENP